MTQPNSCLASTCSGCFIAASVGKVAVCLCVCDTLSWLPSTLVWSSTAFSPLHIIQDVCICLDLSPLLFTQVLRWCCLAAQASSTLGVNETSSVL